MQIMTKSLRKKTSVINFIMLYITVRNISERTDQHLTPKILKIEKCQI